MSYETLFFDRCMVYSLKSAMSVVNSDLLKKQIDAMLSGAHVNVSEDRAAWHTELRKSEPRPEVADVLEKIKSFSKENAMKNIVVIGIGGSFLGTAYVHKAFRHLKKTSKKLFFVSNVDPLEIKNVLDNVDLCSTLFVVISKTLTTIETMMNAKIARSAIEDAGLQTAQHMVVQGLKNPLSYDIINFNV